MCLFCFRLLVFRSLQLCAWTVIYRRPTLLHFLEGDPSCHDLRLIRRLPKSVPGTVDLCLPRTPGTCYPGICHVSCASGVGSVLPSDVGVRSSRSSDLRASSRRGPIYLLLLSTFPIRLRVF